MYRAINKHVVQLVAGNPSPMTAGGTNCYLVGSGARKTLIDTGSPGAGKSCLEALKNYQKVENFKIDKIICTHWHPDHVGGIEELRSDGLDCSVIKHEKVPYKIGRSYPGAGEFLPSGAKYKVLDESEFVQCRDDDVINVEDDVNLVVKFTPGHADDHICLLLECPKLSAVFSGDNILGGTTAVFDNYYAYMKSLERLRDLTPEGIPIYPGHGDCIENGLERIQFYIEHRLEREQQILNQLGNLQSISQK